MNRKKKIGTSLVAILCTCALLLPAVSALSTKSSAKEQDYTQYTLSDVGITDGTYEAPTIKALQIEKYDKVAFAATYTFRNPGSGEGAGFGFVPNAGNWSGLKFIIANEALWVQNFLTSQDFSFTYTELGLTSAAALYGTPLQVRTTFDTEGDNVKVVVTVNGTCQKETMIPSEKMETCKSILVQGSTTYPVVANSVTTGSGSENKPTPGTPGETTYTEFTFRDVGIADGTYKSGNVQNWNITKLDKVAFTGKIQFSEGSAQPGFGFIRGAGDWSGLKFIIANESLYIQDFISGKDFALGYRDLGMASAAELTAKAMKIRVTFDEKDGDLVVGVTVNDTYEKSQTLDAAKFTDIKAILVYGTASLPMTIASEGSEETPEGPKPEGPQEPSGPQEPDTPEIPTGTFTEYTFYNLGLLDGTYSEAKAVDWEITDYNRIAFTGEIQFPESRLDAGIVLAPNKGNWNGLNIGVLDNGLYVQDYLGKKDTSVSFAEMGYETAKEFYKSYVKIRIMFVAENDQVNVTIVFNDKAVKKMTYTKAQLRGVTAFVLRSALDKPVKIKSVYEGNNTKPSDPTKPQLPAGPYKEYTFYNLGLANGTYQDTKCVDWKVKDYDKVAFSGKIAFSESNLDAGIIFAPSAGNWNGLNIGVHDGTLYFQNYLSKEDVNFKITDLGYKSTKDFYGQLVDLRFLFNKHNDKIRMTIVVNEVHTANLDFTKEQLQSLHTFVVRASETKTVRLQSVYVGENKKPESQPTIKAPVILDSPRKNLSTYTEVTFSSLRIEDQNVKTEARSGMFNTLDGKVFKGKVTFPGEGKGSLTVGGNSENMWFGIHIESVDGGLVLYEAANGAQKWTISKNVIGKDITNKAVNLYLTFQCINDHNVYLGVYVDGKFCGERLYAELQEPFGGGVLIYSAESGIKIASVATAWERFLMSKVNLAYFGFTNNWKAELLQRSK